MQPWRSDYTRKLQSIPDICAKAGIRFAGDCELVYAIYGYDIPTPEARMLLKTHIRNGCRKIGGDYIINVRSTGYKLVCPEQVEQVAVGAVVSGKM